MVLGHHHAACVCRTGQDSLGIGRSPGFGTNHHWLYLCGIPFFPGANGVTVIGSLCKQQVSSGPHQTRFKKVGASSTCSSWHLPNPCVLPVLLPSTNHVQPLLWSSKGLAESSS